jgi:hypothetical protein
MSEPNRISSHISKLDIIENHLLASIQMIALEMNPVSTHVIVMACEEMILGLAGARNVFLEFDYRIYIKDESHKRYRKQLRKPYNFFKHADEDPHDNYDGPSEDELCDANELLTVMNAIGYKTLGGTNHRDLTNTFSIAMMIKTPALFKTEWLNDYPELKRAYEDAKTKPQYANVALRQVLLNQGLLPEIPYRGAVI